MWSVCGTKDQCAPQFRNHVHRGKTDGFYNQQVIRQIHHSQSQVEVCEAVIKDRLYLFTDSSHDDDNIQMDHSRDLSFVIVDRSSQLSISHVELRLPFWAEGSFARTVSAALFDA